MPGFDLPYQPIRRELYAPAELFKGFDSKDKTSWGKTDDFKIYCHFVIKGSSAPTDPYEGMMQALHDNSITQSTYSIIKDRKVAAIMGDHELRRDTPAYRDVALLARRLTQNGFLMCTGGGPGTMEAVHFGALLAARNYSDLDFDKMLIRLKTQPVLPPHLEKIVVLNDGKLKVDQELVAHAHAWFEPAYSIYSEISAPSQSLAVPTWNYGQEPTTPFATRTAKYFQNSIREDGLLALAKHGIIFSQGKAGTIQEIFQNATQNFYNTFHYFSPMVLLGVEYWEKTYPVVGVLRKIFSTDFNKHLLVTDNIKDAAEFIERYIP